MVFKDIIERHNIQNRDTLNLFIKKAISNISTEFSLNKFHNEVKSQGIKLSKDFVYELPNYLEDIYLIYFLEKYDKSELKRTTSLKKVYVNDLGFSKLFKFSEDIGRMLENIVFIELKRRGNEIYYHKNKKECDFVIKEGLEITKAIQVTRTLSDIDTRKREIDGLLDAMNTYDLNEGLILTEDEEEVIEIGDGRVEKGEEGIGNGEKKTIYVKPIWKWLLENPKGD